MDKEFKIFDDYINDVSRYIMSKRKKEEISDELNSHLLEEYDRYFALGLSHEDAQEKAIANMGNKKEITHQFAELYLVSPVKYMRSSLNYLICGLLLSTFYINILGTELEQFMLFIGRMLLIFGLFKLRKTDKRLSTALYLKIVLEVFAVIVNIISAVQSYGDTFTLYCSIISVTLTVIMYGFIFAGIDNLCKTLNGDGKTKPKMLLAFICYLLLSLFILIAVVCETEFFAILSPVYLIICLWQLRNAKKVLANADEEFDLKETLSKGEKIIYWVLIFSLIIIPIVSMYAVSTAECETSVYTTDDIENDNNAKEIRENLLKLGFPKEFLDDFPDSEVLQYKNAIYVQVLEEGFYLQPKNSIYYQYVLVYLPQDDVRTVLKVELTDESNFRYRKGLYLSLPEAFFIGDNNENNLYLALYDSQGKTYKSEPLSTFNGNSFNVAGFEFQYPKECKNRRAYVCKTGSICQPQILFNSAMDGAFIYQQNPFLFNEQTMNERADATLVNHTFYADRLQQYSYIQLYVNFVYEPKYLNNIEYNEEN